MALPSCYSQPSISFVQKVSILYCPVLSCYAMAFGLCLLDLSSSILCIILPKKIFKKCIGLLYVTICKNLYTLYSVNLLVVLSLLSYWILDRQKCISLLLRFWGYQHQQSRKSQKITKQNYLVTCAYFELSKCILQTHNYDQVLWVLEMSMLLILFMVKIINYLTV